MRCNDGVGDTCQHGDEGSGCTVAVVDSVVVVMNQRQQQSTMTNDDDQNAVLPN